MCLRVCARAHVHQRLCTRAVLSLAGERCSQPATQHNSIPAAATYLPCSGRRNFLLLLRSLKVTHPFFSQLLRWNKVSFNRLPCGTRTLVTGVLQAGVISCRVDYSLFLWTQRSLGISAAKDAPGAQGDARRPGVVLRKAETST